MAETMEGAPGNIATMENSDDKKSSVASSDLSEQEESSEEELYEVERIMGMSKASGKTLYKVRWRGYGAADDTWEPIENLQSCLDLIEEFEKKRNEQQLKRAKERKTRKDMMEGRTLVEPDHSREGSPAQVPTTLKDTFWKDLEEGRLNLFATDMYSRVKGGGRAPKSPKDDDEEDEEKTLRKRGKKKNSSRNIRERDKGLRRPKLRPKKHSSRSSMVSLLTDSESDSSSSDIENISRDSVPITYNGSEEPVQTGMCNGEKNEVLTVNSKEKRENEQIASTEEAKTKKSKKHKLSASSSGLKDKSNTEKRDSFTSVKVKSVTSKDSKVTGSSKTPKIDTLKREAIIDKPSSPIKSYLSGGSTPPRKMSVESPSENRQLQALASSTPNDTGSRSDRQRLSNNSDNSFTGNVGHKRKHSHDSSSARLSKQRKDSDFSDSGMGSSVSSVTSQDSDRGAKSGVKRRDSVDFSQPLDDIWNGSFLPLLPESTKSEGRGADLSFDIELDDIDLDDLDQQKTADDGEEIVDISDENFRQAVMEGDYLLVKKALGSKKKFDVESVDDLGITLLMYSAQNGNDDIAELLVNHKANINAQQHNGTTSLMLACEHAHICTVALLVELGANVNLQQTTGETALMKAVRRGHKQIVKFLLEHGANFSAQNNSGFTAVTYAKMMRLTEIEDIIVDYISRLTNEFDKQVAITLNSTAKIISALFPLQCFPLSEGEKFSVNFKHELQANTPGVGYLLFVAHARITAQDIRCRFYGPCAVQNVSLNGVQQPPLTEEANFVLSCCPLQHGRNEVIINTVPAPGSKAKLVVCAYKAQLIDS
ncbi:M-phase phosphoprotein 8-like [Mizuhopecten yessoensis]|uniref:M-phase phosphoprotein 8 n=1 Tax=Mizuhopecten yessoensis TaxID=6573 RepID=A0A210QD81_MIZYE|nr:M-phase phosphoprotein 8-like [Mizuhopecten yessoensis]OWF46651.1 M-phase phosphoprotein 8 [Mizuhopecten yessoensis]